MNFAAHTDSSFQMDQMMIDMDGDADMKIECIETLCEAPVHFAQMSSKMKLALANAGVRGLFAV